MKYTAHLGLITEEDEPIDEQQARSYIDERINELSSVKRIVGVWRGATEPALRIEAFGTVGQAVGVATDLAREFDQECVMLECSIDGQNSATKHTWNVDASSVDFDRLVNYVQEHFEAANVYEHANEYRVEKVDFDDEMTKQDAHRIADNIGNHVVEWVGHEQEEVSVQMVEQW